jgi:hypothetical protein
MDSSPLASKKELCLADNFMPGISPFAKELAYLCYSWTLDLKEIMKFYFIKSNIKFVVMWQQLKTNRAGS